MVDAVGMEGKGVRSVILTQVGIGSLRPLWETEYRDPVFGEMPGGHH